MHIKKFEAPTIKEALDTIKRELGPEAVILQTRKNKKGFGLMADSSVEVTAAVSEKSIKHKKETDSRLSTDKREALMKMSAANQRKVYDREKEKEGIMDRFIAATKEKVRLSGGTKNKKLTATRYIDIDTPTPPSLQNNQTSARATVPSAQPVFRPAPLNAPIVQVPQVLERPLEKIASKTDLESEVSRLKQMIIELKKEGNSEAGNTGTSALNIGRYPSTVSTEALRDGLEMLIVSGVDRKYALNLIKEVSFELEPSQAEDSDTVLDQLAARIMQTTEVNSLLNGISPREEGDKEKDPSVIALVGPTGVGKTTTVAKIASEAIIHKKLKVGLINVDTYRIGATEQLSTYGKILNIPFRSVSNVDELKLAMQEFSQLDIVLVDTTGRSQKDLESLNEMKNLLFSIPSLRTVLVLSSITREVELYDTGKRFSMFRPDGLIITKLDESMVYGAVFNTSNYLKLPLFYFTTGQRVPEDIEPATKERVAALLMDL